MLKCWSWRGRQAAPTARLLCAQRFAGGFSAPRGRGREKPCAQRAASSFRKPPGDERNLWPSTGSFPASPASQLVVGIYVDLPPGSRGTLPFSWHARPPTSCWLLSFPGVPAAQETDWKSRDVYLSGLSSWAHACPHCSILSLERPRDRETSWGATWRGREKVSSSAAVTRKSKQLELTDIEGIEHVAGSLRVVATAPDVDGVVYEHRRVPVPHVGHLSHLVSAVCPHWRQLDPAQRH